MPALTFSLIPLIFAVIILVVIADDFICDILSSKRFILGFLVVGCWPEFCSVKFDFNVSKQHHWITINKNTLQPNNTEDD